MQFIVRMPKLSPTMESGTIAKWHKAEGDFVNENDLLLEIVTDKATVEHAALDGGWLRKILVEAGKSAKFNEPLAIFTETKDEPLVPLKPEVVVTESVEEKSSPVMSTTAEEVVTGKKIRISPLAKKLAKIRGLDVSNIKGSGPGGRIVSRDLEKAKAATAVPLGEYEEISLSPVRKIIAERLQHSKSSIPHFYLKQVVDAASMVSLHSQLKESGVKVTFNDIIIRACAIALRQNPDINSGFNAANQTILRFKNVDISIAVSSDNGLITPIVRNADSKSLTEIAKESHMLAERARSGKLQENEYKGGSFTISNLGMYGISEFISIINPPQAAILAVGGIENVPVVKDGAVVVGKTLSLVLSVDHRVADGAAGAQFLRTLKSLLENHSALKV